MRRVIVTGGRHYGRTQDEQDAISLALYRLLEVRRTDQTMVVVGDAPGVDAIAADAARTWGLGLEVHRAEWDRFGRRAGPIRNEIIVGRGAAFAVAFPGGRGTADCVARCKRAGISVIVAP